MFRQLIPTGAALAAILITSGCSSSSGNSDDSDNSDDSGNVSLEGKAADGYLAGARVCLDLNNNASCDDGEPTTTTSAGGGYTLEGVTQEQIANSPIVVEIIVGETIDEDNPGETIDKTYTLTAPAGSAFVSPLTTMVQNEIKENGLSPDEAKASIQARLGTDLDPTEDYVAGSDDGTSGEEFQRLHKVAQVTRAVMQKNIELVNTVVDETGVSQEDLTALIVEQVLEALDDIQQAIETAGDGFDADGLAGSDDLQSTRLDPSKVEEQLEERRDRRAATAANLAALLTDGDGLNFFEAFEEEGALMFGYGNVQADGEGVISITQYGYDTQGDSWIAMSDEGNQQQDCLLGNGEWRCFAQDNESVSTDGNNVRILRGGLSFAEEIISGEQINLENKRIGAYLEHEYQAVIDPAATFDDTALGYLLTFTRSHDTYELYKDNVESVGDCWDGEVIEGNTWSPTDTWCNNVFVHTGDGNHETDGDAATSLSQLVSSTAASNPQYRADLGGIDLYGDDNQHVVELVSGGTANLYRIERSSMGESENLIAAGSTNWRLSTVETKEVLIIDLPADIALRSDYDRGAKPLLAVVDGYVRAGEMMPAGGRSDKQWVFNGNAREQIKTAFDYTLLDELTACDIADNEDSSFADFDTAATDCSAVSFTSGDVAGKSFFFGDGAFSFTQDGNGLYQGEINDGDFVSLGFTWTINGDGYLILNTQHTDDGVTQYLRMNLAKVELNARQISVVSFGQDTEDSNALDSATGEVNGEVWDVR